MYFISTETVNAIVVGRGSRWLIYLETPRAGLRQSGPVYPSPDAARTALGAN